MHLGVDWNLIVSFLPVCIAPELRYMLGTRWNHGTLQCSCAAIESCAIILAYETVGGTGQMLDSGRCMPRSRSHERRD